MVNIIRFLIRDYPGYIEYKPVAAQTFQVERRPFINLSVYKNGTLTTGTTSDPTTGIVTLSTPPVNTDILVCRYAPVWFTDSEIETMAVTEWADEALFEKASGKYTFSSLKAPMVYELTDENILISPTYDETFNEWAYTTGKSVRYEGTFCNVYATAAYLFTIMASDPDRIRANYAGKISDYTSVAASFREQSDRLFKLGGHHFD